MAGLLITALAVGPAGSAAATGTDVDVTAAAPKYFSSGNYQNNAAHTGLAPGSSLPTALKRLWKKDFQGSVSYPLVVGNRIFVTAVPADNTAGTVHAFAFDKRTGRQLWKPVAIGDQGDQNSLAYGSGRLVVLNGVGRLRALDPATGKVLWSRRLSDALYPTRPVYADKPVTVRAGVAYAVTAYSGETYWAVNVATGKNVWSRRKQQGALAPAVTGSRVHMVSSCQQDSFTLTGRPVYQINRGCSGGVWGLSAVLANGRVWATTGHAGNLVLDAKTGKTVGKFDSRSTPVIVGGTAFLTWSPGEAPWEVELQATNRVTGAKRWTQEPNGDSGSIVGQPIATNSVVYVATSQGGVFGYRTTTGKLVWSASTGSSFDPSDGGLGKYIPGLAIGGGVLAVPLGNRLTVFG